VPDLPLDLIIGTDIILLLGLMVNLKQQTITCDVWEGHLDPLDTKVPEMHHGAEILDAQYTPTSAENIHQHLDKPLTLSIAAPFHRVIDQHPELFSSKLQSYTSTLTHFKLMLDAKPFYRHPYQTLWLNKRTQNVS
jgi:hypothetical protein